MTQWQQQPGQFQQPQQGQQFAQPQQQFQQPMQQQQQFAPQQAVQQNPPDDGTKIVIQGRMIWGNLSPKNKKIYGTQQDQIDPKTGKPIVEYVFGLAVPKIGPQSSPAEVENFNKLWMAINTEAGKMGVQWGNQNFAWKVFDADDPNEKREDGSDYPSYYKGNFIVTCSTRIPVNLFAWEAGKLVQVTDADIKTGDYVQVQLAIAAHKPPNPGLYINPNMVARFAFGEAIQGGVDASKVFTQQPSIPQGGSATPIGTQNFQVPQFQQQQAAPQQFAQPQQQYAQPQAAPQMQQAPVQPNFNVLPQNMQQPAQQYAQQFAQPQQQPQQQWQPQGAPVMPGNYNGQG